LWGPRRTELSDLELSDQDAETRALRVRGKGNEEGRVYAEGGTDLILVHCPEPRGKDDPKDPLFLSVRKDGEVHYTDSHGEEKASLSDQAIYKMVKRHQNEASIKEVSPHDIRKTFVGDLLEAIGDLSTSGSSRGIRSPPPLPATTVAARERCARPRAT
jgi:site-specific recombinase XerD